MNRTPLIASLLVSLLIVGALAASLSTGTTPQLGLDLTPALAEHQRPGLGEQISQ